MVDTAATKKKIKEQVGSLNSSIGASDKSYKIGYFIAFVISWVGMIIAVICAAASLWMFLKVAGYGWPIERKVAAVAPSITATIGALTLLLFGQLARAIFDGARSLKSMVREQADDH